MTNTFVIVSGGPGLYEKCDSDHHDTAWSNYADNILLLRLQNKLPIQSGEEVWWLVYGPAYERRWTDDVKMKRKSVQEIKNKGSTSYKNHFEKRASQYGWKLKWLTKADDFWRELQNVRSPISRVWYFGHARSDLWLSLRHSKCLAIVPTSNEIIRVSQIDTHSSLASKFQAGSSNYNENRSSRFYGCNTVAFAEKWAKVFKVYAEGADGKVNFENTHPNQGELKALLTGCTWKKYAPGGGSVQ